MVVALVAAALAAVLHVFIFVMESVLWTTLRVWATFGITSDALAAHTRPLAFNQGFYNLFLAVVTAVGVVLVASGTRVAEGGRPISRCSSRAPGRCWRRRWCWCSATAARRGPPPCKESSPC